MKFLGRMFRYIAWMVFAAAIAWLLKKMFASAARNQAGGMRTRDAISPAPGPKLLYRDPVCGSHVAEEISYHLQQGNETLHFCSRECLEHYRAGDRIAAGA